MRKVLLSILVLLALTLAWGTGGPVRPLSVGEAGAAALVYHGNRQSHVFHRPGCRYFDCRNCVVVFASREEALAAGFRPCKICRP